jgi:hypothetical protein
MKKVIISASIVSLAAGLMSCGGSGSSQSEEVEIPTQGLITIVKEVKKDEFKIDDEITIPDTSQSLIVANYLTGASDTFTLQEARLVAQNGGSSRHGGVMGAASMGLMGFMMGRSMGGFSPSAGAYTSQEKFNKVNSTAGSSLRNTSTRVSRPSGGSGFGSGRSTRSVGG